MTLTTCLAIIAALLYFNSDRICSLQRMNKLCRRYSRMCIWSTQSWQLGVLLGSRLCVCVLHLPVSHHPLPSNPSAGVLLPRLCSSMYQQCSSLYLLDYHFKKTVIVSSYSQILIRLGTILFVIVYQLFLSNETTFLGGICVLCWLYWLDQWLVSSYLVCMLPSVLHMGLFKGKRWYFYIIDYLLISVGILLLIRGVVAMV